MKDGYGKLMKNNSKVIFAEWKKNKKVKNNLVSDIWQFQNG